MDNCRNQQSHRVRELRPAHLSFGDAASAKGLEFQLGLGTVSPPGWASEISFCAFVLFPASGSGTESEKSSCVLAKV